MEMVGKASERRLVGGVWDFVVSERRLDHRRRPAPRDSGSTMRDWDVD